MEFEDVIRLYEQWVIASITGAQIGERAYCLVIGYDADDPDDVHVSLGVGLDRERRGEGAGPRKRWYNPADFANLILRGSARLLVRRFKGHRARRTNGVTFT